VPALVGTASLVPELGFAVPPGDWAFVVAPALGGTSGLLPRGRKPSRAQLPSSCSSASVAEPAWKASDGKSHRHENGGPDADGVHRVVDRHSASSPSTLLARRLADKVRRAQVFAARVFEGHAHKVEIWSPRVAAGQITTWMDEFARGQAEQGLAVAFVVNEDYADAVQELVEVARLSTSMTSEPAFRMLQLLTHLRGTLRL
jgi:hypothetical protein